MDNENSLLCYNKGCGHRYDPAQNSILSCTHHPGIPVFHDAYKGWSCCNKKTTDFTDFLNIKGCATSFHSNDKPPETNKKIETEPTNFKEIPAPIKSKPVERPSVLQPLERIKFSVTGSLKTEIQKINSKVKNNESIQNTIVTPGTSCKNGGCRKSYENESDNSETCMHHPGVPVFHEGMKFWTCCMRRTTDFDSFLEQAGCTVGNHLWIKEKSSNDNKQSCRFDWYQTGPYVYVSIYSKMPFPEESLVEGNPVKLHVFLVFGEEREIFEIDFSLFGIVDIVQSSVQYAASKVEIKLKKAETMHWTNLSLPETSEVVKSETEGLGNCLEDSLKLN